ncbi:hypothetical protein AAVH_43140, partial [Aphelenchoides avenae]
MSFFDWTSFAFIYQVSDIGGCGALQQDLEQTVARQSNIVLTYKQQLLSWRDEDIEYMMNQLKSRAR